MVIVFLISGHVDHFLRNPGVGRVCLIYLTVRCLHKTVLINPGVGSQGVDQADVRALWCLNRAHPPVMGVVDVPDLESCPVPGKAAWP